MELYPAEVERLTRLVEEWSIHDERELEATFKNASDTTTFLAVAQRLKARGYTALPQEDKMNIITPESIRFSLTGLGAIEKYCRDDTLEGRAFEVMRKQRAGVESNLDIPDYGVRIKVRREDPMDETDPSVSDMLKRWNTQLKAFRIMRRWTFVGKGVRFDLSMIRSTPSNRKGEYLWQRTFKEHNITKQEAFYEIEVELDRPESTSAEAQPTLVKKGIQDLIRGIGEVLRGIQKHTFLIRYSTTKKVLEGYTALTKSDRFRGVAPITMVINNMKKVPVDGEPNIRSGYNVTDKADGLRMMGFVDERGELFMIDMSMYVYRTGLIREACANSLVDGEYVTRDKERNAVQQFMLFDCYIAPSSKDVSQLPFAAEGEAESRYNHLQSWYSKWSDGTGPSIVAGVGITDTNKITVSVKTFLFAKAGDLSIFAACAKTLDRETEYHTDGLILTPNSLPLPNRPGVKFAEQLKWKPADENTVDFLIEFDKDPTSRQDIISSGAKPETGETVQHKSMHLYVGSDLDAAYQDPRGTVLFEQPLPGAVQQGQRRKREYKPVLFNPRELPDTMANVCYCEIETSATGEDYVKCENDDPIENRSIIEMRYEPRNEPGWRWIPMRVRYDKTERFQKGIIGRTLNKDEAAEGVWNSIHEPITRDMIRRGTEQPSASELAEMSGAVAGVASGEISKVYYDRKGAKDDLQIIQGLRNFHRVYIKEEILLGRGLLGGGKTFVDLACGQGGDTWSWIKWKADFVFGTDLAGNGIRDPENGAYRRFLNAVIKFGGYDKIGKMIFTIGSSAKNIANGEAGSQPEESNIMRAVLGRLEPDGPIPPFVSKYGKGRLRNGADCVAIMFAIHYFFENELSLSGIMRNISDCLAINGLFVGCCFDGQRVFDSLLSIPEGGSLIGKEGGSEIWKLTKRYSAQELTTGPESLGLAVDIEFISIGTEQREYLVPFEMLKNKMKEIGCELLTTAECKELGLKNSTELFEQTYDSASRAGQKFAMSPTVKQYSFFNRWFIFKRRSGASAPEGETVPLSSLPAVGQSKEPESKQPESKEDSKEDNSPPSSGNSRAVGGAGGPPAPAAALGTSGAGGVRQLTIKPSVAVREPPLEGGGGSTGAAQAQAAKTALGVDMHTIPVSAPAGERKKYALAEVFQFYNDAALQDKLKLGETDSARWLAPSSPFPIMDEDVEYPSLEHYIAAMKYKLATNKPELAERIFSSKSGSIHQEALRTRATETGQGSRALTAERDHELLKAERKKVLDESAAAGATGMKKYKATFDEGKWFSIKDDILRKGLTQRWERDARLRKIVEAAKAKGLVLLYYTGPGSGSDLGGKRTGEGFIDGENKIGRILMELAGWRTL